MAKYIQKWIYSGQNIRLYSNTELFVKHCNCYERCPESLMNILYDWAEKKLFPSVGVGWFGWYLLSLRNGQSHSIYGLRTLQRPSEFWSKTIFRREYFIVNITRQLECISNYVIVCLKRGFIHRIKREVHPIPSTSKVFKFTTWTVRVSWVCITLTQ